MGLLDFVKNLVGRSQDQAQDLFQNVSQTTRNLVEPLRQDITAEKPSENIFERVIDKISSNPNLSPQVRQLVGGLSTLQQKYQERKETAKATGVVPKLETGGILPSNIKGFSALKERVATARERAEAMPDFQEQRAQALGEFGDMFKGISDFISSTSTAMAEKAEADPAAFGGLPFGAGEPRVIKAAGSVLSVPLGSASAAIESMQKGEVVNTAADALITYGSMTGVGALFSAAFGQEEVASLFEKWVEVGQDIKTDTPLHHVTGLHPEIEALWDRGWELVPAILMHKAVSKKGLEVTPDGVRTTMVDRGWVSEAKKALNKIKREAGKDDYTTLKELLSEENIKITRDSYEIMKKETESVMKVEEVKGEMKLPDIAREATIKSKMGSVDYVKMLAKERELARKADSPVVKDIYREIKRSIVDHASPIEDFLWRAERKFKYEVLPEARINNKVDYIHRSVSKAKQFSKDSGYKNLIKSLENTDRMEVFGEYLLARRSEHLREKGIDVGGGRNKVADKRLVEDFKNEFKVEEAAFRKVTNQMLDYMKAKGLEDPKTVEFLRAENPYYAHFERLFSKGEEAALKGGARGKAIATTGEKLSASKKLKGGTDRLIENPIISTQKMIYDMYRQGELNSAASALISYKELPGWEGIFDPVRTIEGVKAKWDILKELKENKQLKGKTDRILKTDLKRVKTLMSEVRKLQKEGVKLGLSKIKAFEKDVTLKKTEKGKKTLQPTALDIPLEAQINKFIAELLTKPPSEFRKISKMIEGRNGKLKPLLSKIESLYDKASELEGKHKTLLAERAELVEQKTKGKHTISRLVEGTKETYIVPEWLADSAKNMSDFQIGLMGRAFLLPARLLKVGTTGLNLAFGARNWPRDQITALNNMMPGAEATFANPLVLGKALYNVVGKGKLYEEVVREGGISTSFDLRRDQIPQSIKSVMSEKNRVSRVKHIITHPSDLLRTLENIMGITEIQTRLQVYQASFRAFKKMGMNDQRARISAAAESRNVTANFARRGVYSTLINGIMPYVGASIQGERAFLRALAGDRPGQRGQKFQTTKAVTRTGMKIAMTIGMPMAATTVWNLSDPRRREAYLDIADWEKDNSLIIVPDNPVQDENGKWNVTKIPLPPGISGLAQPIRLMLEATSEEQPADFKEMTEAILGAFIPIDVTSQNALASTFTPQQIKPTLETFTNMNFFTGAEIVPEYYDAKLEKEAKTAATSKLVTKAFNIAFGAEASPLQIEAWIKGTFGGIGPQGLNLTDHILYGLGIIDEEEIGGESTWASLVRSFTKASGGAADDPVHDALTEAYDEQALESARLRQNAEALIQELRTLSNKEKAARLREVEVEDPAMIPKMMDIMEEDKLGLNSVDKRTKTLNVKNGARAKFVAAYYLEGLTGAERKEVLTDLVTKKVVTESVLEQIVVLLTKGGEALDLYLNLTAD